MKLYDQLTDKSVVLRVNKAFYKKVYEHPWLSQYFQAVTEEFITQQQTDFIVAAIGGPNKYSGRLPSNAHPHMFITDELYDLRSSLLHEAMDEEKAPIELREKWSVIDESFRHVIVKKSLSHCVQKYKTEPILAFKNPTKKAA